LHLPARAGWPGTARDRASGALGHEWGPGYHAPVMWFRRVPLLVAIYLFLDFANPMMPGAVQLVDGSLQTVAGCQARSAEAPAPTVTNVARHLSNVGPPRAPTLRTRAVAPVSSPTPTLVRIPFEPRSTLASSSDDD